MLRFSLFGLLVWLMVIFVGYWNTSCLNNILETCNPPPADIIMSKKSRLDEALESFNRLDPEAVPVAWERMKAIEQIFDSRTHRVRSKYRDRDFAYLVLRVIEVISKEKPELKIWLSRDELRLLNRRFSRQRSLHIP